MNVFARVAQRPWRDVPVSLRVALPLLLVLHAGWRAGLAPTRPRAAALPRPPAPSVARVAALGELPVAAKIVSLWLQAFDDQAGVSLPFAALDYARLEDWLALSLALDPAAQYPLLAASRLYAEVPEAARSRRMLDFVARAFAADPARRWPWLAHAVFVARHRLHDLPLARDYARRLARADAPEIPSWARQLEIFVLEDMGEIEAAKVLLGGLLASGQVTDPHEQRWLTGRLAALEAAAASRAPR
ncbi:MAG: hypothetical protein AB7O21_10320 [Gammaproteobacteria bacterium]